MPTVSRIGTKGSPVRNFTCAPYALGPLVAKALEMKCSSRNAPIGTIPLRECRRRRKNEWPLPARIGGTPRSTGEATLAMYRYTPIRFARQTLYYETSRWPRQTVSRITQANVAADCANQQAEANRGGVVISNQDMTARRRGRLRSTLERFLNCYALRAVY